MFHSRLSVAVDFDMKLPFALFPRPPCGGSAAAGGSRSALRDVSEAETFVDDEAAGRAVKLRAKRCV